MVRKSHSSALRIPTLTISYINGSRQTIDEVATVSKSHVRRVLRLSVKIEAMKSSFHVACFDRYKDAIFFSPHKFVGGPGTPGILIAKKNLFRNKVPHGVGGGTVQYVSIGCLLNA